MNAIVEEDGRHSKGRMMRVGVTKQNAGGFQEIISHLCSRKRVDYCKRSGDTECCGGWGKLKVREMVGDEEEHTQERS